MSYYEFKETIQHSWSRPASPAPVQRSTSYDYNNPNEYVTSVPCYTMAVVPRQTSTTAAPQILDSSSTKLTSTNYLGSYPSSTSKIEISYETAIEDLGNGRKVYKAIFFVDDFKPKEMEVKSDDEQLTVTGERFTQKGDTSERKYFLRELPLPYMVDVNRLKAVYYGNGKLIIEAPMKAGGAQSYSRRNGSRTYPIQTYNSNSSRCDDDNGGNQEIRISTYVRHEYSY